MLAALGVIASLAIVVSLVFLSVLLISVVALIALAWLARTTSRPRRAPASARIAHRGLSAALRVLSPH
ncbi:hypothetical protein [Nonomuraea lactucae]|uniref:hypothetical protein n=1 Tax=Nonomuraea lactucae TaxID=2249762 RepID=UPI0013B44A72|nr:hypothetical protein [Nonomuraea lactucae]